MTFPAFNEIEHLLSMDDPEAWAELQTLYRFYPLNTEGLPLPGTDFVREATLAGDTTYTVSAGKQSERRLLTCGKQLTYLHLRALYDPAFSLACEIRGNTFVTPLVGGHQLGKNFCGPEPSRIMVIGKNPGAVEIRQRLNFVGMSSEVFWQVLPELEISEEEISTWYATNLVRHEKLDPSADKLSTTAVRNCALLLHEEIRIVQPEFILCFGTEASNELLGKGHGVSDMYGRVVEYKYAINMPWEPPEYKTAKVMTCLHPAAVYHYPHRRDEYRDSFALFWRLTQGDKIGEVELDIEHIEIFDAETLERHVDALIADGQTDFAIDAEWHGDAPNEPGAYLRTIQISGKAKTAFLVNLREAGGAVSFKPSLKAALPGLQRLLKRTTERHTTVGGHFLRADMPWLLHYGLDVRTEYAPAPTVEEQIAGRGGWDTSLMLHAVYETGPFGLEFHTSRLCGIPRYDLALERWKRTYCSEQGIEAKDLDGYGMCLHQHSIVRLADDTPARICDLVRSKYSGYVKGVVDGQVVATRVIDWHRNQVDQKEWYRLRTLSTPIGRHGIQGPSLTPDHKVLTQRGKVRVDQLQNGRDSICTEFTEFTPAQLSVFLGSLLGDGGYRRKGKTGMAFGFGQRLACAGYVDWKAAAFAKQHPQPRQFPGQRRYELKSSAYLSHLASRFPAHVRTTHTKRKGQITDELLRHLGLLGLAVWYQDAGKLAKCGDPAKGYTNSRIYCECSAEEQTRVLTWLTELFGPQVSYNDYGRFFQLSRASHRAFHAAIAPYMHPDMAYKALQPVSQVPQLPDAPAKLFYEQILEVVRYTPAASHKGNGDRYCLTTEAGNFLTNVGFVSNCPRVILNPYGLYDADGTYRVKLRAAELLHRDGFGLNSWKAFWQAHRASLGFLEMEMWGLDADAKQCDLLTEDYMTALEMRLAQFRQAIGWEDLPRQEGFNPSSANHVREFLFGEELNGAKPGIDGVRRRLRPADAISLRVQPVKSTGKPSRDWGKVVAWEETHLYNPSTDRESLGILLNQHLDERGDLIRDLRNLRYLGQILKQVLRPPKEDKERVRLTDDDGNYVYDRALISWRRHDRRIHTHLSQVKETGRAASSRPPLQNISKRREDDYKKIQGELYRAPIRSILCAAPGHVLVEADIQSAELAGLAWMANDRQFIQDVARNMLPKGHPDRLDLHADRAVTAFRLSCEPTEAALEALGCIGLRVAAKNVNFGVPYGRAADAIARQCREEGSLVSIEEAQALIDAYHARYPDASALLAECRLRSQTPGWLTGAYGRHRRFYPTDDKKTIGEQERQACNFPIQNLVADYMSEAIWQIMCYRAETRIPFRLVLQIHDALLFEVPDAYVGELVNEVIPECMTRRVPVRPCRLDGTPRNEGPYFFGVDVGLYRNWGIKIPKEEQHALGV